MLEEIRKILMIILFKYNYFTLCNFHLYACGTNKIYYLKTKLLL